MKNVQITIKDIARELNISPSTVSRALKNHPDISQETKKLVTELADKLDYQPNSIALSLRKSKSDIIGIVIPNIVHHFFSTVISGIEDIAYDKGYHLMITQSNEHYQREVDSIHALMATRVDGIFASISSETPDFAHFHNLIRKNTPLVFFDRACDEINTNKVLIDDYGGAFKAVEHLIDQGCRQIVHLASQSNLLISQNRRDGYINALKRHEIPLDEKLIIESYNIDSGYYTIRDLIKDEVHFDGVFAVNDETAIGAIKAIKEAGLKIPEDVAVIGFGDDPIAKIVDPNLSSVSQSGFEMGQLVARLFIDQLDYIDNDLEYNPKTKIISTKLTVRESSKRKS